MNTPQILCVEIRTLEPSALSSEQLLTLTIFVDSQNNYNLATGVEEIKTAIANMIPHLGTNCRYPLMFQVQLIPGSNHDASLFSLAHYTNKSRTRANSGK